MDAWVWSKQLQQHMTQLILARKNSQKVMKYIAWTQTGHLEDVQQMQHQMLQQQMSTSVPGLFSC